jgi:putative tryptophan/tyrosine transport system substrate-binding protein
MTAKMKRRSFITLLGGATAWPLTARAQQLEQKRRIGVLIQLVEGDPGGQERLAAFREVLEKLGWRVGVNLQIDYRWAVSSAERAQTATAELLSLTPDVILANGTNALRAVQQATRTVPIVFTTVIEPVGQGFVANLAHPGGNITGFSYLEASVGGKWLNLLKQIAPQVTRVACLFNPQRGPYTVSEYLILPRSLPNGALCSMLQPQSLGLRRSSRS